MPWVADEATPKKGWVVDEPPPTGKAVRARGAAEVRAKSTPGQVRAANQGATFGFADELDAASAALETGANNLVRRVTGRPSVGYGMGDAYKAVMDAEQRASAQFAEQHPIQNIGAQLVGGVATGKLALKPIQAATSFGGATLRAAGVGAAAGAAAGAGAGRGLEGRATGAAVGAAAGGALGALTPAAVKTVQAVPGLARRAASAVAATGQQVAQTLGREAPEVVSTPEARNRAAQYVAGLARQAKITPEALEAHPGVAIGEGVTTAEALGRTGIGQATALARRTGTTGDLADGQLTQRLEGAPDRLLGHLEQVAKVSPGGAQGGIDAIVEAGRARAKPLYDAALGNPGPVWNSELEELARNRPVVRKALAAVAEDLRNEGKDPSAVEWILQRVTTPRQVQPGRTIASPPMTTEVAKGVPHPTAETWDAVKKAIGRQVERNPITNRPVPDSQSQGNYGVSVAERSLTEALKKHIPGYAEALSASGDYLTVQGAFNRASGSLFSTKTTPAQFGKLWQSWKSEAEAGAARDALAADIFNKAQNGQLRPGRLMIPAVRQKLATAFGQEAADELIRRVKIQYQLSATGNRIRPGINSVTAEAMMAGGEMDNALASGGMKAVGHLAKGQPVRAAGAMLNTLAAPVRGAMTPIDQATRNEVGNILMQPPEETAKLLRSLNLPERNGNPLYRPR